MQDERPVLLFVAPYFAPRCHGGVVQIYLGLLARLKQFRIVLVSDRLHASRKAVEDWDAEAPAKFGFDVERIDAFEFHLLQRAMAAVPKVFAVPGSLVRYFLSGRRQWRALCSKYDPAIVVCGGTYSAAWLMRCNPPHTVLVNYVHGEELTMRLRPRAIQGVMRAMQRWCLRHADLNVAVSRYTAKLISQISGASPEKTKVLPNFIDQKRFRICGRREAVRITYGWRDKTVLLTVARLEKRKGIDQALRALAFLKELGEMTEDWHYVIGGRGPQLEPLQQLTEQLGLGTQVEFLGFVPDEKLPELYEAADLFLQPNREIEGDTEGFGVVFLEANACGLPAIGGMAGGTGDAIAQGRSGLRVDGESVPQIAAAVALLMQDRSLRLELSGRAIEWAAGFDVERAASEFESLLLGLLKHRMTSEIA